MVHFRIFMALYVGTMLSWLMTDAMVNGQEQLDLLRNYPPSLLEPNVVDHATSSIKWQLRQQSAIKITYERSRDEIAAKLEVIEARINDLNQTLPASVRFLDETGRSAMASLAMEQLLGARLDLVSLQSLIKQMESNLAQQQDTEHEIRKMELDMQQRAALSRLELAKSEFDALSKQAQAKLVSDSELNRARSTLEIAETEYAIAAKKAQMVARTVSVDVAKRLSEIRVEVEPVEAKIRTLEEFLETLHTASETIGKIRVLQREQDLWQKDLAMVAKALFESDRKSVELRSFLQLVEGERRKESGGDKDD